MSEWAMLKVLEYVADIAVKLDGLPDRSVLFVIPSTPYAFWMDHYGVVMESQDMNHISYGSEEDWH